MSASKKKEAHSGWPLSAKDARRFRSVTKRMMEKLGYTRESFAATMNIEPRTLYRYLESGTPFYDSQAQNIRDAFLELTKDNESQTHLLDELYGLRSPQMRDAFAEVYAWGEGQRLKTADERQRENNQFNRAVLANSVAHRLARDGRIPLKRKREFAEALYGMFEQSDITLRHLTIKQLRKIRDGPVTSASDEFLFVEYE